MVSRPQVVFPAVLALFLGLVLGTARAQPTDGWWAPVGAKSGGGPPSHARAGLHIPKGHLPPPGQCRLWYPGQPPGQQPPPLSCREAYRRQRGPAYVITHRGVIHGGPPAGWRRRPAGNVVFRRPPSRREGVHLDVDIVIDILGRRGYRRLRTHQRRLDVSGALRARWVSLGHSGGHVLQVRAGTRPLAELVDRNGDGRVESMFFRKRY